VRPVRLCAPEVLVDRRPDGTLYLKSSRTLPDYPERLTDRLVHWAKVTPDRAFMAERDAAGWRTITYRETLDNVRRIGAALLRRNLSAERPIAILSGNDLEHALLGLAANYVGIPYAPISPAYSLISSDFGKLRHILDLLTPGLVFACDGAQYARALAVVPPGVEIVVARNANGASLFSSLAAAPDAADAAHGNVTPDTIAKFLFTSGSTGMPKGVINTQRMWCSNQAMITTALQFFTDEPPVIVDWAPWHHTAGGNHDVGLVLHNGGTMYIDGGKPLPALVGETVKNLAEISPTIYFNVPAGYAALLPHLEKDDGLARAFFKKLRLIFYAGAALPQDLWERLEAVSVRTTGARVPMTSSWGTTETAPLAVAAHYLIERAGNVGVPAPGCEIKLVPAGDKLEVRVRGANVTPGYWKRPDLTAAAFDADGFYRPGDAMRLADANDPAKGLLFDGRLAEDFKLMTGIWVHVGVLRVGILAAASPVLQDAAVAGENRGFIGLLAWLNPAGCRNLIGAGAPEGLAELTRHPAVRAHVRAAIARWNAAEKGTSHRIARVVLLAEPPSIDENEITDKGYINQRRVLERRTAEIERLYAAAPDDGVIVIA
jgi:feruloyl-CoA synthase